MQPERSNFFGRLDLIGATLSIGCAIHCMALPLLVAVLPLIGVGVLSHSTFETVMFTVTVSLATFSLCWGMRIHKDLRLLALLFAAIGLFWMGGFHVHDTHDSILVAAGGFCLGTAHLLNRYLCRTCHSCHKH